MSQKLIWEQNGVYWKYSKKVTANELLETSTILYSDPRFCDISYKLVDFSDAEAGNVDSEDIIRLACQHRAAVSSNAHVKNAIVVHSKYNKLAKKFADLFNGSSWEVRLFQNLEEANNWLGR